MLHHCQASERDNPRKKGLEGEKTSLRETAETEWIGNEFHSEIPMNTVDIPNTILLFLLLLNVPHHGDAEPFPNRIISQQRIPAFHNVDVPISMGSYSVSDNDELRRDIAEPSMLCPINLTPPSSSSRVESTGH